MCVCVSVVSSVVVADSQCSNQPHTQEEQEREGEVVGQRREGEEGGKF